MLDQSFYREAFQRDAQAVAEAARGGLDAPVPSCPGWNVGVLTAHLTGIYAHRTALARARSTVNVPDGQSELGLTPEQQAFFHFVFDQSAAPERVMPPVPPGLIDLFERSAATLVEVLWGLDAAVPIWTWFAPDQTAGFWQRRMALETAVHRWDAEHSYGTPALLESNLAADGVDEIMDVMLPLQQRVTSARKGAGETYHFHRTDGPGEWLVRFEPDGAVVTRQHAKGDAALRAPAPALLLWLWHRIPADGMEVLGDGTLLERYFELAPPR